MELIRSEKGIFMYENGEEIGKAICRYSEDAVDILHVIVKPEMRGNGLAAVLVERVVVFVEKSIGWVKIIVVN